MPRGVRIEIWPASVVARKNQKCVVQFARLFERLDHLADHPIQLLDEVAVSAGLAGALEIRSRRQRHMNVIGAVVEEEGLVAGILRMNSQALSFSTAAFFG